MTGCDLVNFEREISITESDTNVSTSSPRDEETDDSTRGASEADSESVEFEDTNFEVENVRMDGMEEQQDGAAN